MKTNVMGQCYAGMNRMVRGMKQTNANWKQDGKAAEAEKIIHSMTREIGNLTVVMLDGDNTVGPDIRERYTAILEARRIVAEAEAGKTHAKTVCPRCGKKSSAGMHYCGWCGTALATDAE